MVRNFTSADNEKEFRYYGAETGLVGKVGKLEFPLSDHGSAVDGEGILWFDEDEVDDAFGWIYVTPEDVEEVMSA